MYKDKNKQREADRERQKRRRDRVKAESVTNTGCDGQGVTESERDRAIEFMAKTAGEAERVSPKRGKDIKCFADLPSDVQRAVGPMPADTYVRRVPNMTVMERLFYRPAHLLKPGQTNFVSLPGRACYGVC